MTGHAGQLDAGELQILIASPILLEGFVRAVGRVDVEFDREPKVRPVDVELVAGDIEGGDGRPEPIPLDERQEFPLKLGAGEPRRLVDAEGPV